MKVVIILVLLFLVSCDPPSQQLKEPVYEEVAIASEFPPFVEEILRTDLKGWQIVSGEDWKQGYPDEYNRKVSELSYFVGDLNCDEKPDFAGIFKDSSGTYAIQKVYSSGQFYYGEELERFEGINSVYFGIRYMDSASKHIRYDGTIQQFQCGAIERFNLRNKGKKIFYSSDEGLHVIEIGV